MGTIVGEIVGTVLIIGFFVLFMCAAAIGPSLWAWIQGCLRHDARLIAAQKRQREAERRARVVAQREMDQELNPSDYSQEL